MSDSYIKLASRTEVEGSESKSQQVIEWMQRNKYIDNEKSKCGLGIEDLAYKPGVNHVEIVGYDENITRLNTCGVEFKTERQVSNSLAFNPFTKISCKFCGTNRFKDFLPQEFYSDSTPIELMKLYNNMFKVFEQWENMKPAILKCPNCEKQSNLDEYEINGDICLTNFEITFWNWPNLKLSFIDDLGDLIKKPIKRMNGHI